MRGALLDTSVLIAGSDDVLRLPESTAISIITLGELYAGVALAGDDVTGAQRAARLVALRRAFEPLVVDEALGQVLRWSPRGAGRMPPCAESRLSKYCRYASITGTPNRGVLEQGRCPPSC